MDKSEFKRFIFFIILGIIGLEVCFFVLTDKGAKKNMYALRYEPRNTVDIIFGGNSHANDAFLPMELWDEYGYTGYSYSQMSQTFPLVYYSMEDAIRLQHPNLVVVDLFAALSFENDFPNVHLTIDNLSFPTRLKAIYEFVPKSQRLEYLLPFYLYHDRWDELEKKDFIPYRLRYSPFRNPRKGVTLESDWKLCQAPQSALECFERRESIELSDTLIEWYGRFKDLCEKNNAQLLFVVVPYQIPIGGDEESTVSNMKMYNATEKWCEENGVGYFNVFQVLDEMEFDYSTDMRDTSHVNVLGAEKVTLAVGSYIHDHYDIVDHRNEQDISKRWNKYFTAYVAEKSAVVDLVKSAIDGN